MEEVTSPKLEPRPTRPWRLVAVLVMLGALIPIEGRADKARKQCVTKCRVEKKACISTFNDQFANQRGQCKTRDKSDRKKCKKDAKATLRKARSDCKSAFKNECKPCCREGATDCTFTVCGDGEQAGSEQCDFGDRIDGDGCSAQCAVEALPSGPLGTRTFSFGPESKFFSSALGGAEVATPKGVIVMEAGEPDGEGVAAVKTAGGPFFITTEVQLFGEVLVRICAKIDSCTGEIYCNGGTNVDVSVELDSLKEGETCERTDLCDQGSACCDSACEGFVDPNADPVVPVGSGNTPVTIRTKDVVDNAQDSGPGAMIVTCRQTTRSFGLSEDTDCSEAAYETPLAETVYTTGSSTARVINHCPTPADIFGTPPDPAPELTVTGTNFNCFNWPVENSRGAFSNALPTEEMTNVIPGDAANAGVFYD
jgi:cysteine-rich repeat protein